MKSYLDSGESIENAIRILSIEGSFANRLSRAVTLIADLSPEQDLPKIVQSDFIEMMQIVNVDYPDVDNSDLQRAIIELNPMQVSQIIDKLIRIYRGLIGFGLQNRSELDSSSKHQISLLQDLRNAYRLQCRDCWVVQCKNEEHAQ